MQRVCVFIYICVYVHRGVSSDAKWQTLTETVIQHQNHVVCVINSSLSYCFFSTTCANQSMLSFKVCPK